GSSLPASARAVRSTVYFSSAWRASSAFSSCTLSPPRTFSIAASRPCFVAPAALSRRPASPPSSSAASRNSSLAMNASPRCCASLSVTLSSRPRSLLTDSCPACPVTFGSRSSASPSCSRSSGTLTPACDSSGRVPPSCWSISATSRCTGSIMLWSRPTASDCASASACWKRDVSLSIRMGISSETVWPARPAMPSRCGLRRLETSLGGEASPQGRGPPPLAGEGRGGGMPGQPRHLKPPPSQPPPASGGGAGQTRPSSPPARDYPPPPLAGEGRGGGHARPAPPPEAAPSQPPPASGGRSRTDAPVVSPRKEPAPPPPRGGGWGGGRARQQRD